MKRKIQIGVSVLFCLLLGLGAGTASLREPMTWTIEQRSYQEVSLPEQVITQVSLYPGCEDYSAVTALQPEMVQKINQQLKDLLPGGPLWRMCRQGSITGSTSPTRIFTACAPPASWWQRWNREIKFGNAILL